MRRLTRRISTCTIALILAVPCALAQKDQEKRLEEAGTVMEQILNAPDNIPQKLLDHAKCVVVLPSVVKAAFGVGGSYGHGAMVCRTGANFDGPWGAPAMYSLEGGSFGFQIGGQATDVVLLVMNKSGVNSLLRSKVKLGADASIAAGPKGRAAEANTDAYMRAEILSYSRSRGVFAGVSLQGATLHPDDNGNDALYGHNVSARQIIEGPDKPAPPPSAQMLDNELAKASPRGTSKA
ncbi:MAG TPA: lipid-binding SYLF domain-containing protein [Candidatus Acidoferrales bacterium]|nr:lipid-binding SYLF domain-containing protein [Candidatus Acidoferrales bacterium]